MRGKDYNTGLRGVLFEAKHYERMGAALWLYGWLVLRQTHEQNGAGYVLGGTPVSYCEIEEETGFRRRTLETWMRDLRREGYIETESTVAGVKIRIMKAKKFPQGVRKFANGVRKGAGRCTQESVTNRRYRPSNQSYADRISSSYVIETIERKEQTGTPIYNGEEFRRSQSDEQHQNRNATASCSGEKQNQDPEQTGVSTAYQQYLYVREARLRWQQLREEREEATRRELRVGTGPVPGQP